MCLILKTICQSIIFHLLLLLLYNKNKVNKIIFKLNQRKIGKIYVAAMRTT